MVMLSFLRCQVCGATWLPRQDKPPVRCPRCGIRHWDRPRTPQ